MTDDDDSAKEWVTVKVPKADKKKADEYRPDGSTFGDCLVAGADRLNDTQGTDMPHRAGDGEGRVLSEDAIDELVEEFAVAVEPEQGMVDDAKLAREVAAHIDYAKLANRTADELEGRMR